MRREKVEKTVKKIHPWFWTECDCCHCDVRKEHMWKVETLYWDGVVRNYYFKYYCMKCYPTKEMLVAKLKDQCSNTSWHIK